MTRSGRASRTCAAIGAQLVVFGGYRTSSTTSRPRCLAMDTMPILLSPAPYETKSVEPFWLVRMATRFGGVGRLATASKSWLGTNSFGVEPIDQPGNWQRRSSAARGPRCAAASCTCAAAATAIAERMFGVAYGPDDEVDLVLGDQLLVERADLRLVGLVVADDPLHLPAEQPAAGVEPLDERLAGDLVDDAGRGERAAERQRRPDHDRPLGRGAAVRLGLRSQPAAPPARRTAAREGDEPSCGQGNMSLPTCV